MRRSDYIIIGLPLIIFTLIGILAFKAVDAKFTASYKQLEASWAKCETKMVNAEFIVDPRIHMCFYSLSNDVSFIVPCSDVISLEEFKPVRHCWKVEGK
jgi:hypothetical protein